MRPTVATFNFTDRERIEREFVRITGGGTSNAGYFCIEKLDLNEFSFESGGEVVVECYTSKYGYHRFEIGSIEDLDLSRRHPFHFGELSSAKFNIRIVSNNPTTKGRVLGEAHGVSVEIGGRTPSLLPIDPTELDQRVWNLHFDGDNGPVLLMNERLPDYQQIALDNGFRAVTMVAIIKEIGRWVLKQIEEGESDEYTRKWSRAFTALGHNPEDLDSEDSNAIADYPEKLAKAYARSHTFFDKYLNVLDRSAT